MGAAEFPDSQASLNDWSRVEGTPLYSIIGVDHKNWIRIVTIISRDNVN